jgi:hypothetical protein
MKNRYFLGSDFLESFLRRSRIYSPDAGYYAEQHWLMLRKCLIPGAIMRALFLQKGVITH